MKALRYLLIVLGMMSVLAMSAQTFGKPYRSQYTQQQMKSGLYTQAPSVEMRSTSALSGSGSTLPQAALTGAYTADEVGTTTPTKPFGRIRREDKDGDGFEDEEDPELPDVPYPIGDAALPLMLLACAYLLVRAMRRRKC